MFNWNVDVTFTGKSFSTSGRLEELSRSCKFVCANGLSRQCILDAYQLTECPHCKSNISVIGSTGDLQVLCNLDNEGGLQEGLDILPLLTEESYLKAYPEERRCRAFLEFCREGDIEAIVDLIQDEEDADDADKEGSSLAKKDILRYQDTLGPMYSGLHIAVINQEVEVAWLLLFLASNLDLELFPPRVLQTARNMRIERVDASGAIDIRALMDVDGRTARYYASAHHGDIWTGCPLHI
ncbi:hypothetical protein MMC06_004507 [Schaereria dolodes]|nr:hypothetical protein [Schaereria dolodes]